MWQEAVGPVEQVEAVVVLAGELDPGAVRAELDGGQIRQIRIRHRAGFAYVDAELADGTVERLVRLRYTGSATSWGFAIYLYSKDGYEDSFLPTGHPTGTPEQALDCAAGLYFNNPTAWLPPTN